MKQGNIIQEKSFSFAVEKKMFDSLFTDASEILKMLKSIIITAKHNQQKK